MKKLFICSVSAFLLTVIANASNCGGAGYTQTGTYTQNTCNVSFNFLGLTKHTGNITTYTVFKNDLTGQICQTISTSGCGVNGGSWDWPWEK